MSTRFRALAPVLAAALVLAACSGDDTDGGSASADPSGSTGTTSTTVGPDPASVPAEPSAGCGSGPADEAESVQTLPVGGQEREYQRHVPPGHDGSTPMPLVLDLHGYSEGAPIHARHTELGTFGDEAGFITITPQGQGEIPFWDPSPDSVDVEFVALLLDAEEAGLCVDTNRIHAAGLSNGAFMTSALACIYEDRIASAAPVAGLRDLEGCELDRPVPMVTFHGTEDQFVRYDGGLGPAATELPSADGSGETLAEAGEAPDDAAGGGSVPEMTAAWAERNGCEPEPTEEQVADDVTLITFSCPSDATTELYRVDGGGHSWPGSDFSAQIEDVVGRTTFSIDANEIMWDFFQAHPLS